MSRCQLLMRLYVREPPLPARARLSACPSHLFAYLFLRGAWSSHTSRCFLRRAHASRARAAAALYFFARQRPVAMATPYSPVSYSSLEIALAAIS